MMTVFTVMLLAFSVREYFTELIDNANKNMISSRISIITSDDKFDGNKISKLFYDSDFVTMVINQNDFYTGGKIILDNEEYPIKLKTGNSDCTPDTLNGNQLNFDDSFEVLLPDDCFDCNTNDIIGKNLKFVIDKMDFRTIADEASNTYIIGGRPVGSIEIELNVAGTYDRKKSGEELYTGYISYDLAKILHSSDMKDNSGTNDVIFVITRSVLDNIKVEKIASDNHLSCTTMLKVDTKILNLINIVVYIVVIGMAMLGIAVTVVSAKLEYKKNISDYFMLKAYGYKRKNISAFVFTRIMLINIISMLFSVPVAVLLFRYIAVNYINEDGIGNTECHIAGISVIISVIFCLLNSFIAVIKIYFPLSEITVKDLTKYE